MTERTPIAGLNSGYLTGENGWGDGVNANWLTLELLSVPFVNSTVETVPPASPDDGDRYLIPAGATGVWAGKTGQITIWFRSQWLYFTPNKGWYVRSLSNLTTYIFNGVSWSIYLDTITDEVMGNINAAIAAGESAANIAESVASDKIATISASLSAQESASESNDSKMAAQIAKSSAETAQHASESSSSEAASHAATASYAAASTVAASTIAIDKADIATVKASEAAASAYSAFTAAMSVKDTWSSFTKTLHIGTVIAATIYDTSKDSDGGAWRNRCQNTSWYKESINGVWLGQAATAAAAWALSGAVTGAYFQNSTDGKFYVLGASSPTVAETFRGNTREFPAVVEIVAESNEIVIYDATKVDRPMWMVFKMGAADWTISTLLGWSATLSSIAAMNGIICVGNNHADGGLTRVSLIADIAIKQINSTSYGGKYKGTIAERNGTKGYNSAVVTGYPAIVSGLVNSVAIAVLDAAPIAPATGLPTPTIAVATAGGVSVLKDDGTVASDTQPANVVDISIKQTSLYSLVSSSTGGVIVRRNFQTVTGSAVDKFGLSSGGDALYRSTGNLPLFPVPTNLQPLRMSGHGYGLAGSIGQLSLLKENPSTKTKGMVDYITAAYNSGWQVGDILGAWLSDTAVETIAASGELIANGTFTTNLTGWEASSAYAAAAAVVSGEMQITATAANGSWMQAFSTVVGKTYAVSYDIRLVSGTGNAYGVLTNSTGAADTLLLGNNTTSTAVKRTVNFVATATTTYIAFRASNIASVTGVDNVSVKLAEADRSVKNLGLVVNGNLTKAAVASSASLVAYSGFSATNHLEQPYNSQLDFGTGDFCVMGWVNLTAMVPAQSLFSRTTAGGLGGIEFRVIATGLLEVYLSASVIYALALTSSTALSVNTPTLLSVDRASGVLTIRANGVAIGTVANSTNLTFANAITRLGNMNTGIYPVQGSLSLWRISATAPSADQIAYIYETERRLFEPNAQCTLAGTSNAITSLAYDDSTDILHVGTDWGRSGFQGLTRIDSVATTVGTGMKLAVSDGSILTCGTNASVYQPAFFLRDELRRKKEAREALGKIPVFFDFDATASQTTFLVPSGYTVEAVYSAGTLKRIGSTKDYTITSDGFKESVVFGAGLSVSTWVSIMCVRV